MRRRRPRLATRGLPKRRLRASPCRSRTRPSEIRFTRRTVWNVGTADGATEHVFEDGDEVELPRTVALVFVGMGAAVWSGDTEVAVKAAGEKATRSRGRRK